MNVRPIAGLEAFQKILELTRAVNNSTELWLKLGHDRFIVGNYTPNGHFPIWETKLTDSDDSKSRIRTTSHDDCWNYVSNWAKHNNGGVFFVSTQPQGFPLKEAIAFSDDIAAELDEGTAAEQLAIISEFITISGLEPSYIVHSGSKSYHPHWKTTEHLPIEQTIYLRQLVCIALNSDPAISNPHQPMRIAGFYRREKGREQTLEYWSESRYTYDQFITGIKNYFIAKDTPFPETISEERWRIYKRGRRDNNLDLSILIKPESELYPKVNYSNPSSVDYSASSSIPLHLALSKANQNVLNGVGSDRNNTGLALALDLIGCHDWLISNGYFVEGDPHTLFLNYCQSCSPGGGWNPREWNSIWRSASRKSPTPARQDLSQFVHWYRWDNDPKYRAASIKQWKTENDLLLSEPDPPAYQELREAQLRDKKQFLADNALNAEERDKAIRKLSRYVGLKNRDRKDLQARGLRDSQIETGLFFSIDPWIRFNINLPNNLPGIHYQGDKFSTKDTGYACPIFDQQGRAIAWQLRLEGVTKGNKYKWAKSSFSSHLPNSELPITLVNPPTSESKILYVSEGILKSYIAASKLNLPFCGAAGGHFSGSHQQFRDIQPDYDKFVIAPDAGDVINRQVMKRWERQINSLKQFNKPIQILWWGQTEKKKHQDIDEIDLKTFTEAEYLTPEEFFALARQQQWIQNNWEVWRNYKKFTSQIKINKRFVEFQLPNKDVILFIKSALGTGKTTQLIKILEQLPDHGILNQGYRNTLLLQFNEKAKKFKFYHLQNDKNLKEFSLDDPHIRVSNCIDSLIHYVKEQFNGKIVILDEVVSVIKHMLYSGTIKDFRKIKELFTEMVNRAERIICLDGFMQDWVVKFFKEVCPGKEVATLENIFQGDKPKTYLLEGTIDIDENIKVNDKAPWLEILFNSPFPAMFSDSQVFCEALDNLLQAHGYSGIRVDSKTVSTEEVKQFLKNPDLWIQENKPQYFIGSPSIESGLDVSIKNYFSAHFLFFFGQLDIDSCIQMLGRIRDSSVPKYIWCKKFVKTEDINRPSNMEAVEADRARKLMAEMQLLFNNHHLDSPEAKLARMKQIYLLNLDPYTTAADTIKAIHNHEFPNYRDCFKEQLIAHGYPVESIILESTAHQKALAKKEREAKTEVKQQNALDIFNASDKYIGQQTINLNFDAGWEARCAVEKAKLINQLPGINESEVWSPEFIKFIKYDQPKLIKQTQFYYLFKNPEVVKQLTLEKYNRIFNRGSIDAPWKLRQDYSKVIALIDVGIEDFIQMLIEHPDFTYNEDTPEVQAILKKCRYPKNRNIMGTPGKNPLKYLNNLLRSFGADIRCHQDRDGANGTRQRNYSLNHKSWLSAERLAVLQATNLKYDEIIKQKNQPLEWLDNCENSQDTALNSSGFKNQGQSIDTYSLDSVTHEPLFYINKSSICDKFSDQVSTGNQSRELDNTSQLQDSKESSEIMDIAQMLSELENGFELSAVREGFTPEQLNQAWLMLDADKRKQVAEWAKQKKNEWDFTYIIEQMNQQIKRVGGTIEYWKEYLLGKYNVTSRLLLSDEQIIEFWNYLLRLKSVES